ncbi:MAG: hypothetical protein GMKNLPBB_01800 [Myxococcota bacterium]|nr:hypothetical protein [Myxococcota bacterium]
MAENKPTGGVPPAAAPKPTGTQQAQTEGQAPAAKPTGAFAALRAKTQSIPAAAPSGSSVSIPAAAPTGSSASMPAASPPDGDDRESILQDEIQRAVEKMGLAAGARKQRVREMFVMNLYALLKNIRMHELHNQAVDPVAAKISETIESMIRFQGMVSISLKGQNIYCNRERLKFTDEEFSRLQWLVSEWRAIEVGGVQFVQPIEKQQLKELCHLLASQRGTGVKYEQISRMVDEQFGRRVRIIKPATAEEDAAEKVDVDLRTRAYLCYSRMLVMIRQYFAGLENVSKQITLAKKVRQCIQEMIDVAQQGGHEILGLTTLKIPDDYLPNHTANVIVLSMLMGSRLGLSRRQLMELGMSALGIDAGQVFLPAEITGKNGPLTPEERVIMERHPTYSVQVQMRLRSFHPSVVRRILVAFEHHINFDGTGYPFEGYPHKLDLFTRIIAIADGFDALTTARPHRPAFMADEALRILQNDAGKKYDPALVKVFINVMGIYPVGTCVQLTSGEFAVVVQNHAGTGQAAKPTVKIVATADRVPISGALTDLRQAAAQGIRIVRTVDAAKLGINVPHLFYGA